MSENKFLKCTCTQCGGPIEFPADGIGSTVACPHCGWQTELTLAAPEETSARPPRSLKWTIAGAVILAIGIVGGIGALFTARHLLKKREAQRETTEAPARPGNTNRVGSATPAKETATIINGFSTSEVKIQKSAGSTLVYAVGTVKNGTDKQRFGVTVDIDLLDNTGKKIGTTKDYNEILEPHAQWTFRALVVKRDVTSARVTSVREQP